MKGFLILIALIVVAALFCGVLPAVLQPALHIPAAALPVIQLPAENLTARPLINLPGDFNDIYLTNTLVATIIADLIVLIIAVLGTRNLKMIPGGLQNVVEMLIDLLNGFTEQVAGKKATGRSLPEPAASSPGWLPSSSSCWWPTGWS